MELGPVTRGLTRPHPLVAVLSSATAVVALIGGWQWAALMQPGGFDARTQSISELASSSTPHRWVMTAALVVTGLAHLVTAAALGSARTAGRLVLAAAGVATLLVAAFPLPSAQDSSAAHLGAAVASFVLLAAWPVFAAQPPERPGVAPVLRRPVAWPAGAALLVAVATLGIGWSGAAFGLHERVVATLTVCWPLVTAVGVWWSAGHRIGSPRVRHVLAAALLSGACALVGAAATDVVPVTAQTRLYQATVSLDPDPRRSAELVATTTFGDVEVAFSGLAPGVLVVPQVKASITEVLSRPGISLSGLQPGPEELNATIRETAAAMMLRFAAGALLVAILFGGGWSLARRRRPSRAVVAISVIAWAVSTLGTAAAMWATYQPSRAGTFRATEVLGTLQQNQGLLGDVEARATKAAPYLRNLLALSTALQQKYAAGALESDPALRVLFVSDIHDANQYSLMKTIVQDESVDLVIDTGDLLNFGTVQEGEAAGIFTGIRSVGVPYLFLRGNHDATSANDTSLLERMASIPNVVLLQPPSGDYTEVIANGIKVAGFNDPRFYGDSGGSPASQVPAREAFQRAFADYAPPDVVASHEPWAVEGIDAGILLNGHIHAPDLEGNRIQGGTFTGGGPFSHFVAQGETGELVGQPYAFDILTFGTDCRLSSLTRYRFHDVIEGRPAYDDVTLINGSLIDTRPVDPARTCEKGQDLQEITVPRVAPGAAPAAPRPAGSGSAGPTPMG